MKKCILVIFFLSSSLIIRAGIIQILIVDGQSQQPVPFASVYFNKYSGAISGISGSCSINISTFKPNDTLWISCIGYNRKALLMKYIDTLNVNKISLNPVVYQLNSVEIITKAISPYELLSDAFKKIKQNCENSRKYYKASYFEQIRDFDDLRKWHTRTVNSAIILDDPGYNGLHNDLFGIKEDVYFVGINKNKADSLVKVPTSEGNYLKWTLEENYCRYKCKGFNSPDLYNYSIKSSYFDSTLKTDIIEISIIPKNPKKDELYAEVFISSTDHKIFKIHKLINLEQYPDPVMKYDKDYYVYLNSDVVEIFKLNNDNKMVLSYIKYEFGDGFFYYDRNKPHIVSKKFLEYKCIGEIENGAAVVKKLPKMENSSNIYDQKIMKNKAFWLDYNIILKE
ncbi:MAG: hypothetical protein NTZ33_10920 [Bacteroidetes bacterium]|nr:hypothetical protein [Bacteroidota bacterium]